MDLIGTLAEQTGVGKDQARGGAGLIFKLAQDTLSAEDFGQISQSVPEARALADAARQPAPQQSGGLGGMLGGLASAVGGNAGALGGLASLTEGFSGIGLDSSTVAKFLPIVLSFVQQKGGDSAKAILENVVGAGSK